MNTTQIYAKDTTEQKYVPTKVLFARNLPLDTTEQDLVRIFSAFGPVFKVLLLINKANAFIEFQTQQAAESCIKSTEDIYLHNQKLYVSFSSRETISSDRVDQRDHFGANRILLVTINNVRYPVTADTLYTVFSKCGEVLRIVSFPRQLGEQALIEYRTVEQAKVAKFTLEGQGMYGEKGANVMRIQYSERTKLDIGNQTLKAQDYTRQGGQIGSQYNGEGIGMRPSKDEFMGMFSSAYQQIIQGGDVARDQPDELENSSIFSQFDSLQLQPSTPTQDDKAQPSKVLLASNLPISPDVNPQSLFTIFGIYGNVTKIKILFNKRDNALIEFETSEQAQTARDKLNKIPLKGQILQISFSKHSSINFKSSEESGDSSLQQDFSHSWQHRFRVEGSKNYENIYPPNKTVLFSNLHESLDEETLRGLLSENDLQTPQKINYFKVNHDKSKAPMAFVKLSSISEALEAIVHLHNKNFEGKHIKVSFAKNTI
ncbi:hypothetical protein FGO68_gene13942 [Halteria grandinella]|uniref:RRM domain-containing protein n=1 Tax=Halteria grandinella TaxID=5974 RepID=A0A8J8T4P5_HALGN|nr:hypothetical protein FGO68_gene13942 [Halteria grandinella]